MDFEIKEKFSERLSHLGAKSIFSFISQLEIAPMFYCLLQCFVVFLRKDIGLGPFSEFQCDFGEIKFFTGLLALQMHI